MRDLTFKSNSKSVEVRLQSNDDVTPTGVQLNYQDAPSSARLLGWRSSWDYNVVTVPGAAFILNLHLNLSLNPLT